MITNQNLTFQYYLSFLAFISKKDCPNIKFETVKKSYERIIYIIGINIPISKYHLPLPAIPFFPLIINNPEMAKKTSEKAKKSPIKLHPLMRL